MCDFRVFRSFHSRALMVFQSIKSQQSFSSILCGSFISIWLLQHGAQFHYNGLIQVSDKTFSFLRFLHLLCPTVPNNFSSLGRKVGGNICKRTIPMHWNCDASFETPPLILKSSMVRWIQITVKQVTVHLNECACSFH